MGAVWHCSVDAQDEIMQQKIDTSLQDKWSIQYTL